MIPFIDGTISYPIPAIPGDMLIARFSEDVLLTFMKRPYSSRPDAELKSVDSGFNGIELFCNIEDPSLAEEEALDLKEFLSTKFGLTFNIATRSVA